MGSCRADTKTLLIRGESEGGSDPDLAPRRAAMEERPAHHRAPANFRLGCSVLWSTLVFRLLPARYFRGVHISRLSLVHADSRAHQVLPASIPDSVQCDPLVLDFGRHSLSRFLL